MKRIFCLVLAVLMLTGLCACGGNSTSSEKSSGGSFKMTTEFAAEHCVEDALNQWMSTKFLSFECTEFEYKITETVKSNRTFSGDATTGNRWYTAYGTVTFLDKYGDTLLEGEFSVFFGHNAVDSCSFISEETVVNIKY